ncbi:hypothetical protein ASD64_14125 [Mesorhizobium sp. Root157]|uniref:hypothetical protein n=1 Tax=Mesorhizobium sp. Root157 TaxID=1736477 RepID=UPI0006FF8AFF|nr:hypothetical protein [Mesorhizobium sp. Root157]KQZ99934.1 hypothetical protein ASD64_14125 [Mesorhizobium sp. Root157]
MLYALNLEGDGEVPPPIRLLKLGPVYKTAAAALALMAAHGHFGPLDGLGDLPCTIRDHLLRA